MIEDLLPAQRELAEAMSQLSENAYCADWMPDREHALWRAVADGPFRYGQLQLTTSQISKLRELAAACGGWIRFDDESDEVFVPMAQWMEMYDRARANE